MLPVGRARGSAAVSGRASAGASARASSSPSEATSQPTKPRVKAQPSAAAPRSTRRGAVERGMGDGRGEGKGGGSNVAPPVRVRGARHFAPFQGSPEPRSPARASGRPPDFSPPQGARGVDRYPRCCDTRRPGTRPAPSPRLATSTPMRLLALPCAFAALLAPQAAHAQLPGVFESLFQQVNSIVFYTQVGAFTDTAEFEEIGRASRRIGAQTSV